MSRRITERRVWQSWEIDDLMMMHAKRLGTHRMAQALNRSRGAVIAQLDIQRYRQRVEEIAAERVDPAALMQREIRHAASCRQDLTGLVMGDPPPGFSALDKQRGCYG